MKEKPTKPAATQKNAMTSQLRLKRLQNIKEAAARQKLKRPAQ